jgi:hypothetical protein
MFSAARAVSVSVRFSLGAEGSRPSSPWSLFSSVLIFTTSVSQAFRTRAAPFAAAYRFSWFVNIATKSSLSPVFLCSTLRGRVLAARPGLGLHRN